MSENDQAEKNWEKEIFENASETAEGRDSELATKYSRLMCYVFTPLSVLGFGIVAQMVSLEDSASTIIIHKIIWLAVLISSILLYFAKKRIVQAFIASSLLMIAMTIAMFTFKLYIIFFLMAIYGFVRRLKYYK